eukprot:3297646-Karenia_brevis.AAC.1
MGTTHLRYKWTHFARSTTVKSALPCHCAKDNGCSLRGPAEGKFGYAQLVEVYSASRNPPFLLGMKTGPGADDVMLLKAECPDHKDGAM